MLIRYRSALQMAVIAILLISLAGVALADEIVMTNGDRLSGRIIRAVDGALELETAYAGTVKIDMAAVQSINSDQVHELHLANGEVLKGQLSPAERDKVKVGSSAERSATTIALAQVQSIDPPPEKPERWHGSVTIGGTMKSGNTESRDTSVAVSGVRRSENDRISLKLRYNYGEEDDVRTAENTYGAMKYDYFVTEKVYTFLSLEFLIDEFKDINLRTVVGPGVGYQLLDEEDRALSVEAGLSYFNEDRDTAEDESWLTARLGGNLHYRLLTWLTFDDELLVYPSLEKGGEYQLRNEAALTSALGTDWSLNLTNIYEHDSQPPVGIDNDDLTWILGLQYAF